MERHISLSQHINLKLNENEINAALINEGLFDWWKKNGGIVAAIYNNISSVIAPKKESPVLKAMRDQMKSLREEQKKKAQEFKDSQESKMVAKIEAKFALKKKQLSLKWDKKIKEQNSIKKRYENEKAFFEKSNRIYTQSELKAIEAKLENDLSEVDPNAAPEGSEKIRENLTLILRNQDGTMRTPEQIKDYINGPGAEIWKDFEKDIDKNSDNIIESIRSSSFKEYMNEIAGDASDREVSEREIEDKKNSISLNEHKRDSVKKLLEMNQAYLDKKNAVKKFGNSPIGNDNICDILKSGIEATDDEDTIKTKLKEKGLTDDQIAKICGSMEKVTADTLNEKLSNADTLKTALGENAADDFEAIVTGVKSKKEAAEQELKNTVNPLDEESEAFQTLSAEEQKMIRDGKTCIESEMYPNTPNYDKPESLSNITETYSKDIEAEQKELKSLEDKREEQLNEEATRQEMAKETHKKTQSRKDIGELKNSAAYKKATENDDEDLNPGESKDKNGKVGFVDANGVFHEKPDVSASDEEYKNYEKNRKTTLAIKPLSAPPVIKKQENGKYTITYPDGETYEDMSEKDAAEELAKAEKTQKERVEIEEAKKSLAEELKKITREEYNKLVETANGTGEEAELAKAKLEVFKKATSEKDFFKDVGAISQKLASDAQSNIENSELDFDYSKDGKEDVKDVDDEEDWDEEDGSKKKLKDLDDEVESDEEEDDPDNPSQKRKKKIQNPAKIYHKKTYKRGSKTFTTKSYYDKNNNAISQKEYQEKVTAFKNAHKKKKAATTPQSTTDQQSLSQHIATLLESKHQIKSITLTIGY